MGYGRPVLPAIYACLSLWDSSPWDYPPWRTGAFPVKHSKFKAKRPPPHNRSVQGRFLPGVSGNPGGRPAVAAEVAELAQSYGPEAIHKAVFLMRHSDDERTQLAAAELILNRAYGKPAQAVTGADGRPLSLVNVVLGEGRPITDPQEAARIYFEILGHPEADLSHLRFAALEHEAPAASVNGAVESATTGATTAPSTASEAT